MPRSGSLRWLHASSLWTYRVLTWGVFAIGFAFAAVVLSLRYWVLPNVERYREDIAQAVSRAANQRITIDKISANWDGIRPELVLENVTVFGREGRPALELARIDLTLSWLSLAAFEPRFQELEIHRPALDVRRDKRGVISVAGVELSDDRSGGGFADWILRQRRVVVHDAAVSWHDELRGAPRLELKQVRLQIASDGNRHRFGLRAAPPPELAGAVDVRGDLTGETVAAWSDWNGKLFVQLDYLDIAAWHSWVPFPVRIPQGAGALRAWLTFNQHRVTDAIADVRLANVRSTLAQDLAELDLTELSGRIRWKSSGTSFEFSTSKLGFTTQRGLRLQPADFLLRLSAGQDQKTARGELHANALDLEPLVALADRLPLEADLRKQLMEISPKGTLFDVVARWSGDWRAPVQYSVRGRFQNLAHNRVGKFPGVSGLTGSVDGSEKAGTLHLDGAHTTLDMPLVFREPLAFDSFVAEIGWLLSDKEAELRLKNISFSNPHFAGMLSGNYRTAPSSLGLIDLAARVSRADARHVGRYIPLVVGKSARDWLDTAFLAGQSNDVTLRLKGDLSHFPFPDGKGGAFQVVAKVSGGALDYAKGWPKIENIAGEAVFRGNRMDITAHQGTIFGVRLTKVRAEIPDLKSNEEILRVTGEAEGPTSDFLAFIEKSPVRGMIDRFTDGMTGLGNGKLELKLEIPLRAHDRSKVAGTYHFTNNHIVVDPDLPPLEQAKGQLEFTESAVRVPNAGGMFLGGPISIGAATQSDGAVRVNLQGRANIDNLRRSAGNPWWTQSLRGAADWKGELVLRKKLADLVVESNLSGMASSLPAPFSKSAAETVPLRYERKFTGENQDQISFSYGDVVSGRLARRIDGGRGVVRRGTIRFGGAAAEPERDGVWVGGAVKSFDLDRWLALKQQDTGHPQLELAGLEVKIGELAALDRLFHDVAVSATVQGGIWQATLSGRELEGSATWRPQGRGKLTARMKRLIIPASGSAPAPQEAVTSKHEPPALDIVAEQFQLKDKVLGRLELLASPEERDLRIEKLRVTNPESTLAVDGLMQDTPAQPRTQISLRLDVNDIGRLLTRLGHPEGVRRGTAKLEGTLTWAGGLAEFDYPVLSGNLVLDAVKGQFVKLEPGIGKLLGILSLQALPRRIAFDFRDIFSEGFAFDQIIGAVKINRGIASTENFRIQGPSARVLMTGDVDLARETQRLRVKIIPSLSDSVSIAGALIGGPVAGVATFLAQKMLKDPIEQIATYEYNVTGTWKEPQVSKIEQQAPPDADRPQ